MPKTDFKKTLKQLYNPPREFTLVEVPEMQFLMVDGHGDPNTAEEYRDAVDAAKGAGLNRLDSRDRIRVLFGL